MAHLVFPACIETEDSDLAGCLEVGVAVAVVHVVQSQFGHAGVEPVVGVHHARQLAKALLHQSDTRRSALKRHAVLAKDRYPPCLKYSTTSP